MWLLYKGLLKKGGVIVINSRIKLKVVFSLLSSGEQSGKVFDSFFLIEGQVL